MLWHCCNSSTISNLVYANICNWNGPFDKTVRKIAFLPPSTIFTEFFHAYSKHFWHDLLLQYVKKRKSYWGCRLMFCNCKTTQLNIMQNLKWVQNNSAINKAKETSCNIDVHASTCHRGHYLKVFYSTTTTTKKSFFSTQSSVDCGQDKRTQRHGQWHGT